MVNSVLGRIKKERVAEMLCIVLVLFSYVASKPP